MNKYEFYPEIWFQQSEQHFFTNNYIHAHLVCGSRWHNEPLVMGKKLKIYPRYSFEILSDYYLKNQPYQRIVHPIAVRLLLRKSDYIQDPEYVKSHYPENTIPRNWTRFLPKEIPEITCQQSIASHVLVCKDCQEYGYSMEVATAVLYWAYKITGKLDASRSVVANKTNIIVPHPNPYDLRMKEIHEHFPEMWKVAAFANWPMWDNQKIKLSQRVEILKNLGFILDETDLKRECSFFGIKRSFDLE